MTKTTTSSLFDGNFSLKLAFLYILAKLKVASGPKGDRFHSYCQLSCDHACVATKLLCSQTEKSGTKLDALLFTLTKTNTYEIKCSKLYPFRTVRSLIKYRLCILAALAAVSRLSLPLLHQVDGRESYRC